MRILAGPEARPPSQPAGTLGLCARDGRAALKSEGGGDPVSPKRAAPNLPVGGAMLPAGRLLTSAIRVVVSRTSITSARLQRSHGTSRPQSEVPRPQNRISGPPAWVTIRYLNQQSAVSSPSAVGAPAGRRVDRISARLASCQRPRAFPPGPPALTLKIDSLSFRCRHKCACELVGD